MENKLEELWPILPIADTVSGTQARENPQDTIDHYQHLQTQLWLSPKVRDVADSMLSHVQQGRTAWGSLSGPYGFGKTAAAISLWTHARNEGFLAIPPLSCTNQSELQVLLYSYVRTFNRELEEAKPDLTTYYPPPSPRHLTSQ